MSSSLSLLDAVLRALARHRDFVVMMHNTAPAYDWPEVITYSYAARPIQPAQRTFAVATADANRPPKMHRRQRCKVALSPALEYG